MKTYTVSIGFQSPTLSLTELSGILGKEPNESSRNLGDPQGKLGKRIAKYSTLRFHSDYAHEKSLLDCFADAKSKLGTFDKTSLVGSDIESNLAIASFFEGAQSSDAIPTEILEWAVQNGMEIDFSTYGCLFEDIPGQTFTEVEAQAPNGFHDAHLYGYSVDFRTGRAELDIGIDISEYPAHAPTYTNTVLIFYGLKGFMVEGPRGGANTHEFSELTEGVTCDAGILSGERLDKVTSNPELRNCQAIWFFLNDTNSFIYIFCRGMELVRMDNGKN